MNTLLNKILAELHAAESCADGAAKSFSDLVGRIRGHFLDHAAADIHVANQAVKEAVMALEDAASRGFPDHNEHALRVAHQAALARQAAFEGIEAPVATPEPANPPITLPDGDIKTAEALTSSPATEPATPPAPDATSVAPNEAVICDTASGPEAAAGQAPVETKIYTDGTVATGTAPLPEQSPGQQDEAAITPVVADAPAVVTATVSDELNWTAQ